MGNEGSHEMEYMAFIFVACWLASEFCPSGNVCLLEIEMTALFFFFFIFKTCQINSFFN